MKLIANAYYNKEVLLRVQSVKHVIWIGITDIKDMYVEVGKEKKPFLTLIAQFFRHGWKFDQFMQKNLVLTFRYHRQHIEKK